MFRVTVWKRNLNIINDKYYNTEIEILLFTGCFKIEIYNTKSATYIQTCISPIIIKTEVNVVFLCFEKKSVSHSDLSDSETPWTVAHQPPLSMGFSRILEWVAIPFFRGSF